MFKPLPLYIGLRYTRAKRRNHFISFISLTSILGVGVGVMALITVLSVMNGFESELRSRILGMAAHATIVQRGSLLQDWQRLAERLASEDHIIGVAPYIRAEGMLTHAGAVNGALIRGVLPDWEPRVSVVAERMVQGDIDSLQAGRFNIILGRVLARKLRVKPGDKVTVVAPEPSVTVAGILPRLKRFTVTGIFEIGMQDYDASMALVHMDDAARLFRKKGGVSGLRLKVDDITRAHALSLELIRKLPGYYAIADWTQYHRNFFRALKTEKTVMFVILALIVAVAAFNIVSTLVMVVTDKQADIAILRTLGLSPRGIMGVFMVQGTLIGLFGTLLGLFGGVWLASHVETIVPAIEDFLHTKFLPADVYYISELPSRLEWSDVGTICGISFLMCLLGTIYPAWRASRTQPAEALRYE